MIDPDLVNAQLGRLDDSISDHLAGGGQFVRWRHQRIGDRTFGSQNAHGMDPGGMEHTTDDRHKRAIIDEDSMVAEFIPVQGDLIITLRGAPRTVKQAEAATPVSYYKVTTTPKEHRDRNGKLLCCTFEISLDRSGQW
jgi:hypothetical protein